MKTECEKVKMADDEWSEWVSPVQQGYLMQCCDCGLIHEIDFQVVKYISEPDKSGLSECEIVEDKDYAVNFRAKRYEN